MGLNPSCNNVSDRALKKLPVLGDPPFKEPHAKEAVSELKALLPEAKFTGEVRTQKHWKEGTKGWKNARVGLSMWYEGAENDTEEVKVRTVEATALGWKFSRAWYYWVCNTYEKPIPAAAAKAFNDKWGDQVRFNGYAGGTDADGPGKSYHVDTLDGLLALVKLIREHQ